MVFGGVCHCSFDSGVYPTLTCNEPVVFLLLHVQGDGREVFRSGWCYQLKLGRLGRLLLFDSVRVQLGVVVDVPDHLASDAFAPEVVHGPLEAGVGWVGERFLAERILVEGHPW